LHDTVVGFFDFIDVFRTSVVKKVIYFVFYGAATFILYLFAYNSGKTNAELSCAYEQQKSLKVLNDDMMRYKKYWRDSYEQRKEQIQKDIDSHF